MSARRTPSDLRMDALERQIRQLPSRYGRGGGDVTSVLVIINGNALSNGASGVTYASTVSLGSAPDVNGSSNDLPAGLGRAQLYTNGALVGRVFIRHDRLVNPLPLCAGDRVHAVGTVSITAGSGSITAYRWEW